MLLPVHRMFEAEGISADLLPQEDHHRPSPHQQPLLPSLHQQHLLRGQTLLTATTSPQGAPASAQFAPAASPALSSAWLWTSGTSNPYQTSQMPVSDNLGPTLSPGASGLSNGLPVGAGAVATPPGGFSPHGGGPTTRLQQPYPRPDGAQDRSPLRMSSRGSFECPEDEACGSLRQQQGAHHHQHGGQQGAEGDCSDAAPPLPTLTSPLKGDAGLHQGSYQEQYEGLGDPRGSRASALATSYSIASNHGSTAFAVGGTLLHQEANHYRHGGQGGADGGGSSTASPLAPRADLSASLPGGSSLTNLGAATGSHQGAFCQHGGRGYSEGPWSGVATPSLAPNFRSSASLHGSNIFDAAYGSTGVDWHGCQQQRTGQEAAGIGTAARHTSPPAFLYGNSALTAAEGSRMEQGRCQPQYTGSSASTGAILGSEIEAAWRGRGAGVSQSPADASRCKAGNSFRNDGEQRRGGTPDTPEAPEEVRIVISESFSSSSRPEESWAGAPNPQRVKGGRPSPPAAFAAQSNPLYSYSDRVGSSQGPPMSTFGVHPPPGPSGQQSRLPAASHWDAFMASAAPQPLLDTRGCSHSGEASPSPISFGLSAWGAMLFVILSLGGGGMNQGDNGWAGLGWRIWQEKRGRGREGRGRPTKVGQLQTRGIRAETVGRGIGGQASSLVKCG